MIHPLSGNELKYPADIKYPKYDLKNKAIGIFTIGPVQSFISSAKKTKDFWAGSYLLSYLTWTALEVVIRESSNNIDDIVFPAIDGQPLYELSVLNKKNEEELKLPTLPNRFMALLDKNKSSYILRKCEKAVKDRLNDIIDFIIYEENIKSNDGLRIKKQIDKLLEIYWISIPFEQDLDLEIEVGCRGSDSQYSVLTSLSEELLGSRKNLRNFEQQKENGHKCHICGEREGIVKDRYVDKNPKNNPKKLCGVCLLKRHFDKYFTKRVLEKEGDKKEIYYPSVVEVAIMDYKKKIVENADENTIKKLVELIKDDELNEGYDKGIQNWYIKKFNLKLDELSSKKEFLGIDGGYLDINGDKLKDVNDELKSKFMRLLSELQKVKDKTGKRIKFNKYYALIYLDGDSMGKWVSGEMIKKAEEEGMSPKLHYLVSKSLTNYTKHVKKIFEKKKGVIVYAGGDDVVAFVNLEDLFDVMRELRAYFSGYINENGEIDYENDGIIRGENEDITLGKKASASMGVCIAHYKKPLRLVIKKAKEMEALAKKHKTTINEKTEEKNAFAIAVLKNSGEVRTASLKWIYSIENDKYIDTIENCIKPILKMIEDEKLSRGYVYALKEELSLIPNTNNDELIKSEIKRISKRKIIENDKSKREEPIGELNNTVIKLYDLCNMSEGAPSEKLGNFISMLEIVSFIGRRGD